MVAKPPGRWRSRCVSVTALATALATAVSVPRETMPDVATPALTAPLIGRETEIGELRDAWNRASEGESAAVVLAGDADIGKTRLITEFATEVTEDGGLVLLGHCLGLGQAAPPFLPVLEIISQLRAASEDREILDSTERLLRADVAGDRSDSSTAFTRSSCGRPARRPCWW